MTSKIVKDVSRLKKCIANRPPLMALSSIISKRQKRSFSLRQHMVEWMDFWSPPLTFWSVSLRMGQHQLWIRCLKNLGKITPTEFVTHLVKKGESNKQPWKPILEKKIFQIWERDKTEILARHIRITSHKCLKIQIDSHQNGRVSPPVCNPRKWRVRSQDEYDSWGWPWKNPLKAFKRMNVWMRGHL